jgi:hypothetical protein
MSGPGDGADTLVLNPRVRYRTVGESFGVLVHLERGTVVTMNAQAARTLALIAALGSRAEVAAQVAAEQDVPLATVDADLEPFLAELRQQEILR